MSKLDKNKFGAYVSNDSHPFSIRVKTREVHTFFIDVFDHIENLSDVEDAIYILGVAQEEDQVVINLNCFGGNIYAGESLIAAMNNCQAPIHVRASGMVASFATFILLSADSFEISPHTTILCHSMSYGSGGKQQDVFEEVMFTHQLGQDIIKHYYEGFLTEDEIKRIIESKYEHLMRADEFLARFERRQEMLSSRMEDAFTDMAYQSEQ